jgi:hypothetical protein
MKSRLYATSYHDALTHTLDYDSHWNIVQCKMYRIILVVERTDVQNSAVIYAHLNTANAERPMLNANAL